MKTETFSLQRSLRPVKTEGWSGKRRFPGADAGPGTKTDQERSRQAETESAEEGCAPTTVLAGRERIIAWLAAAAAMLAAARLFYRTYWAALFLLPLGLGVVRLFGLRKKRRRTERLRMEFIDGMDAYISALKTGYSAENALYEATRQLRRIYGKNCLLAKEFAGMQLRLSVNETLESLFAKLAVRTGIEETSKMAEIIGLAKRSGGALITVMEDTVRALRARERLRRELRAQTTARRTEFLIMAAMPPGMLLYLELTASSYMDPLYRGLTGRLLMTLVLILYGASVIWGLRMMKAEE